MRERKIQDEYRDHRFGFEVILRNAPMMKVRGEWLPDINANHLRWAVLAALAHKPGPLTGNEVRFIRQWLELTTTAFGKSAGVSHAAVIKWENLADEPAKISPGTEFRIRFLITESLPPEVTFAAAGLEDNADPRRLMSKLHANIEHLWQQSTIAAPTHGAVEVPAELLAQQYLPLLREKR